jgi:hypothetical protein
VIVANIQLDTVVFFSLLIVCILVLGYWKARSEVRSRTAKPRERTRMMYQACSIFPWFWAAAVFSIQKPNHSAAYLASLSWIFCAASVFGIYLSLCVAVLGLANDNTKAYRPFLISCFVFIAVNIVAVVLSVLLF